MNNVVLMGRLIKDPDLRYNTGASGNFAIARFTLAVDKGLSKEKKTEMESKGQPTADFITIVCMGKLGENVAKYTGKGLRVLVNGRIQTNSWTNKDGVRQFSTEVLANGIEFLDWKSDNNFSSQPAQPRPQQTQTQPQQPVQQVSQPREDFTPSYSDDFEYAADFDPTEDSRIPF